MDAHYDPHQNDGSACRCPMSRARISDERIRGRAADGRGTTEGHRGVGVMAPAACFSSSEGLVTRRASVWLLDGNGDAEVGEGTLVFDGNYRRR